MSSGKAKGLYRKRMLGVLTKPLETDDGAYGGVILCGTFRKAMSDRSACPSSCA